MKATVEVGIGIYTHHGKAAYRCIDISVRPGQILKSSIVMSGGMH
jgi:hypothetical protein